MADYLLDCSDISKDEKKLIQTVCLDMSDFKTISTSLRTHARGRSQTRKQEQERVEEDDFESVEDQIEQDVVCAFLSTGWDGEDESMAEECSTCVHDELFSLYMPKTWVFQ